MNSIALRLSFHYNNLSYLLVTSRLWQDVYNYNVLTCPYPYLRITDHFQID